MSAYYIRLALNSFLRTPGLTVLMVCAIGLGIGVCVVTMTVYHAMSGDPIWWKSDRLYAVTLDSWDPERAFDLKNPQAPPPEVTYKDAVYLLASKVPLRKTVMYAMQSVVTGGVSAGKPLPVLTRAATSDFFAMFDVPFLYGGSWDAAADQNAAPVVVLSKEENNRLFGGSNSVGRTIRWNDHEVRIVGVLDAWFPQPRFYDVNDGAAFDPPEDMYVPFNWAIALEQSATYGNTSCWGSEKVSSFQDFLHSECVWMQMWVELPTTASREQMQTVLDNYWAEQHKSGRFQRPRNNRLTPVGQWLEDQGVIKNDNRLLVAISFAFLAVCLLNTVGILLAKFLNSAAISGLRRALGASRRQIFIQHLVEVGALATAGALLGLVFAGLGLWGVHTLYVIDQAFGSPTTTRGGYQELTHFDTVSVMWAVALAIVSAIVAGLYPAWRIGRVPPAVYLKSQ
jgi:putative ABC transport system permease protein